MPVTILFYKLFIYFKKKIFHNYIRYNPIKGIEDHLHLLPFGARCNNPLFAVIYFLERSPSCWKGQK